MDYGTYVQPLATALLRDKLNRRAIMSRFQQTQFDKLSPGKKLAFAWRLEAAYRAQVGRYPLTDTLVKRLSERLPDDAIGLAEGIIYYTFGQLNRKAERSLANSSDLDILPILWHLPGHLCNVLASEIMSNPSFDEVDLTRWLDKHDIDVAQPLPDLKHMRMEPAKK